MRCTSIGLGTALAIALPALASTTVQAAPIIYTETATASGTLNGVPFTDGALTLTYIGDTANISSLIPGLLQDANGLALFRVDGVGAGIFTGGLAMSLSNNTRGVAGFVANTTNPNQNSISPNGPMGFAQGVILATYDPAVFTTYDLATSIGPVTGPAIFDEHASAGPVIFPTTAGNLSLTSAGDVTYTAKLGRLCTSQYRLSCCGLPYFARRLGSPPVLHTMHFAGPPHRALAENDPCSPSQ